jgi:hypothetical protein
MTTHVIKIIGFARDVPCPWAGQYLLESTPHEEVKATFTDDLAKAKRMTQKEAFETWTYAIGTRPDGKPDRPLTAFTVEIVPADEELTYKSTPRVS